MSDTPRLETVLTRDRTIVLLALSGVAVPVWVTVVRLLENTSSANLAMPSTMPDMPGFDVGLTFAMWTAMMVAMMLPASVPVVLMFAAINRRRDVRQRPFVSTAAFLSGYLVVWLGFSAMATITQGGLYRLAVQSPSLANSAPLLSGLLLIMVGAFQWIPLKHVCLNHCRSPQGFFLTGWREGLGGAVRMGLNHGRYCVGCCWLLMSLFFLTGVMNLTGMAALAAFVSLEKVAPAGRWLSRAAGLLFIGWGAWMAASALL